MLYIIMFASLPIMAGFTLSYQAAYFRNAGARSGHIISQRQRYVQLTLGGLLSVAPAYALVAYDGFGSHLDYVLEWVSTPILGWLVMLFQVYALIIAPVVTFLAGRYIYSHESMWSHHNGRGWVKTLEVRLPNHQPVEHVLNAQGSHLVPADRAWAA